MCCSPSGPVVPLVRAWRAPAAARRPPFSEGGYWTGRDSMVTGSPRRVRWGCHTGRDPSGAVGLPVRGGPERGLYWGAGLAICAHKVRCLRLLGRRKSLRGRA